MPTFGVQNLPSPPPPMPGTAGPQPGPGPQGDAASLLGPQIMQARQAQQRADMQETLRAAMGQFSQLNQIIDALATQHPEAAVELNNAKDALRDATMKVTSSLTSGMDQGQMPSIAA